MQKGDMGHQDGQVAAVNPIALKKISVATAVTISGTISGRLIRPNDTVRN